MDTQQLKKMTFHICNYTEKEIISIMKYLKDNKLKFVANRKKATAIITRKNEPTEQRFQISFDELCKLKDNI